MKHWFLSLLGKVEEEFVQVYTSAGKEMSKVVTVKMTRRKIAWILGIDLLIGAGLASALWIWVL